MDEVRFNNFRVYTEAKLLHRQVFLETKELSREYDYLVNQIRRAALSIVLNIAEGSGKMSDKDFNRYIANALGSTYEVLACLEIIEDLAEKDFKLLAQRYHQLRRQLGSFSKKLKADS